MKKNKLKSRGFTLIELLVVIVIIATLAGISGAAYTGLQKSTLKKRNVTLLNQLGNSIDSYHLDFGEYPEGAASGDNSAILYACLFEGAEPNGTPLTDDPNTPINETEGKITVYAPYLDPNKGNSIVDPTNNNILDPYDNPYLYLDAASNTDTQNPDFDLWSSGKDEVDGYNAAAGTVVDDVTNW